MLLKYADLITKLNKNSLSQLYYFHGEETWLQDESVNLIESKFCPGQSGARETYYGAALTARELINNLLNISMFSSKNVIVVKELKKIKSDERDKFVEFLENSKSTLKEIPKILVFIYPEKYKKEEISKNSLLQAVSKMGESVEFTAMRDYELVNYVVAEFGKNSKKISKSDAEQFVELAGTKLYDIKNEIEKLMLYIGSKQSVSGKDIYDVCGTIREETVYRLNNALMSKNKAVALEIIRKLIDSGEHVTEILSNIYREYIKVLKAKLYSAQYKMEPAEIIKRLGFHPYYGKIFLNDIAKYDITQAIKNISLIHKTELGIKSGKIEQSGSELQLLILRLCR